MSRRALLSSLLFTVALLPLHASGAREADVEVSPPEDERSEYVVRFQIFEAQGLSAQNEVLSRSVPRLLKEEFSLLPEHELSWAEREAQAQALLDEAVRRAAVEVDSAVEERAELRFETGREDDRRRAIKEADEKVAEARARLAAVEAIELEDIEIAETKPLSFGDEDAEPFQAERIPARVAREEDLDLLITGSVEEVDSTIIVRVRAYNRFLGHFVYERSFAGAVGDTDGLVAPIRDDLAEVVLGRPWGRVSISTSNEHAAVYVDDRLVGFGSTTVDYARVGTKEVRVSVDGLRESSRRVQVTPRATTEVDIPVVVARADDVRIESEPSGADVYLGSVWQGITPLTLSRPTGARTVILSQDGFLDETVILSEQTPDQVDRELVPDPGNWPEVVQERRDKFYRSFGWFALSLPLPVMFNGMYQDIAALFPGGQPSDELGPKEAERLAQQANAYLWTARGTAVLSGGLFVHMMVRLIQYIRAGQYAHDEQQES